MSSSVLDQETLQFGRLLHFAGLAVVLICGAVAYNWCYAPVAMRIVETEMKIDDLIVSRQNAEAIRHEHARLSSHLQDIEARYAALEQRVPLNAEAGSFLKQVSEIARKESLIISNFQPAQSISGDGFTSLEVMLDGKGTFASICSFFARLSSIQRLSKVKDLSVGIGSQSEGYPMKATIVIYYGLEDDDPAPTGEMSRG